MRTLHKGNRLVTLKIPQTYTSVFLKGAMERFRIGSTFF